MEKSIDIVKKGEGKICTVHRRFPTQLSLSTVSQSYPFIDDRMVLVIACFCSGPPLVFCTGLVCFGFVWGFGRVMLGGGGRALAWVVGWGGMGWGGAVC